jgi:uncharacterized membrane protein
MNFVWPQFLLLAIPVFAFLWFRAHPGTLNQGLRFLIASALILALAQPSCELRSSGRDVIVLVDRSSSMPNGSVGRAEEVISLLLRQRTNKDRLGVISFAQSAHIEMQPSETGQFAGFFSAIDSEASNLSVALDAASELIPAQRAGRVLVLSDGKITGGDAVLAARRLASRGIEVDVRALSREDAVNDVAVTGLTVAPQVSAKEPFLLTATVKSQSATSARITLLRDGQPILKTTRALIAGNNLMTLRDFVEKPGLKKYELKVESDNDATPENDVGRAVVRIEGPLRTLLITKKPNGVLMRMLYESKFELDVKAPFALSLDDLDGVSTVVLEDIDASALSEKGLVALERFVSVQGGGLVMTGGRHSFGEGGFRKSPLEDLLPVSLEVREEQRKAALAMSIIMDCSCSMGATVPDGRTKMELAAEGVVGALQLLNQRDEASVHMVDTAPHELFPLSAVSDGIPYGKIARGFSGGGGIYIDVGLQTAKKEILSSSKETRHVLLFTDAADSEQPGDYQDTLAALTKENVTVSVIGMGSRADSDAKLLEEIASLGHGRMYFAEDATSLPRIFSQETIAVARSTYIEVETPMVMSADISQLGKWNVTTLPTVGGYNLTYLKPRASVALRSKDDNQAPLVSFWPNGSGRTAAVAIEIDGTYTGQFRSWKEARALIESVVRWTAPQSLARDILVRSALNQNELTVSVDFAQGALRPISPPVLTILGSDAATPAREIPMHFEEDDRLVARFVLPKSGTWHPLIKIGNRVIRAAPVTLPWSPEFEPVAAKVGIDYLVKLAQVAGGTELLSLDGFFEKGKASIGSIDLSAPLIVLLALALLADVLVRRFFPGARLIPFRSARAALSTGNENSKPKVVMAQVENVRVTAAQKSVAALSPEPTVSAKPSLQDAIDKAKKRTRRP